MFLNNNSLIVTPFPGAIETKPGSATVPFFGIKPAILDPVSGKVSLSDAQSFRVPKLA
jgi:acyl-coenzyme A synthetase/AMP-(fatty) acid ligase